MDGTWSHWYESEYNQEEGFYGKLEEELIPDDSDVHEWFKQNEDFRFMESSIRWSKIINWYTRVKD